MIVRSVLVTAINLDLGQVIWWPSKLAKADEASLSPVPDPWELEHEEAHRDEALVDD